MCLRGREREEASALTVVVALPLRATAGPATTRRLENFMLDLSLRVKLRFGILAPNELYD